MDDNSLVEFEVLSPDSSGLSEDDVGSEFRPLDCNRQPDPQIESAIAATWERRLAANPRLFNGSKFRLHELLIAPASGASESKRSKPLFRLGLTSYRDYLGTNCNEMVDDFRRRGLLRHGNTQAFLADPLGVGTLLVSSDRKFVLLRRSQWCGEAQGLIDAPGGHPEPENVPGILDDPNSVDPALLTKEIFDSIVNEVVDEVNIPRCKLGEPRLLGIIKNNTTGGRKTALFIIKCEMSSVEIQETFDLETQSEAYESTAIMFLTENELLTSVAPNDYAPHMRGGLSLYFHLKNKEKNQG